MIIRREAARALGWDKQIHQSLDAYDDAVDSLGTTQTEQTWANRLEMEREAKYAYWWRLDDEARDTYEAAIEEDPANLEARFDLAQVYTRHRHWEEAAEQYQLILDTIDARHRRAQDALYKNGVYHHPELTTRFEWFKEQGRGDLLDIETSMLTEQLKQEIARRTDLSLITSQMWHRFERYGGGSFDEYQYAVRLDHQFDMKTRGHVMSGTANLEGTDDEDRWIWEAELTTEVTDWLNLTVGGLRQPWRKNVRTVQNGLDEKKIYLELFGEVDPWTDLWVRYDRHWIENGTLWLTPEQDLVTKRNGLHELSWGANYRFSLAPKVLQFEYWGFAWWFDRTVPTYFSPRQFAANIFRLNWRHYLNNDQYIEQKKLYYEIAGSASIDSDGVTGWGYDAGLGWDICHHFGLETHWTQTYSTAYDSRILYLQLVARF